MLRALWLGRLDEAAPVQVPHGLLELEAPAELEAAAAVGEAAEPEGGIAQVAEQVCMVATADREYCSCARRIMLSSGWWCSCRPCATCALNSCSWPRRRPDGGATLCSIPALPRSQRAAQHLMGVRTAPPPKPP